MCWWLDSNCGPPLVSKVRAVPTRKVSLLFSVKWIVLHFFCKCGSYLFTLTMYYRLTSVTHWLSEIFLSLWQFFVFFGRLKVVWRFCYTVPKPICCGLLDQRSALWVPFSPHLILAFHSLWRGYSIWLHRHDRTASL